MNNNPIPPNGDDLFGQFGGSEIPEQIKEILSIMSKVISQGDGVSLDNDSVMQIARSIIQGSASQVSPLIETDKAKYLKYFQASSLWIDSITDITPKAKLELNIYSRLQFVNLITPTITKLVYPVADKFSNELTRISQEKYGEDEMPDFGIVSGGFSSMISGNNADPSKVIRSIGLVAFTMQIGQVIGNLALSANTSTDLGVCLLDDNKLGLLPNNIKNYALSVDLPEKDVEQFFVLKENARVRLFNSSKWLKTYLQSMIENYARSITINTDLLEEQMIKMQTQGQFMNPNSIHSVFDITKSAKQTEELQKIELVLSLIESWVNTVCEQSGIAHIEHIVELLEMSKREFSEGKTLQPLTSSIGIKMSPGIYNKAHKLMSLILSQKGALGRDAIWSHPDMLPTLDALNNPLDYIEGKLNAEKKQGTPDWDKEFSELLS
jgi:putative hydrolase